MLNLVYINHESVEHNCRVPRCSDCNTKSTVVFRVLIANPRIHIPDVTKEMVKEYIRMGPSRGARCPGQRGIPRRVVLQYHSRSCETVHRARINTRRTVTRCCWYYGPTA